MKSKIIFLFIFGLDALNLIYQTSELSISYRETQILYGEITLLQFLTQSSLSFFGQNDFALRLPMILAHLLSVLLMFNISKFYLKDERNRLWLILIFILLPGVLSSAIIIDEAGMIIFSLLLFTWLYLHKHVKSYYLLLVIFSMIESSYIYLFIGLIFYSLHEKNKNFFIFNIVLLFLSIIIYGVDAHGIPKGHFLDVLALYAAIFSPLVFIYIVFVLYRKYLDEQREIIWFISTTALIVSLVLSFRQNIKIEQFAPYLILALPIVAKSFSHSYRVRLKQFRKIYKLTFLISLILLSINTLAVLLNKNLYLFLENPRKHFVYKYHVAKELAEELKHNKVNCLRTNHPMQKRLYFYGVTKCDKFILSDKLYDSDKSNNVTISYINIPIYSAYVTKINK